MFKCDLLKWKMGGLPSLVGIVDQAQATPLEQPIQKPATGLSLSGFSNLVKEYLNT